MIALAVTLAGCGKRGTVQGGNDVFSATTLTVYSVLPFQGSDSAVQTSIVNGERLALYQAGGHVSFPIGHGRSGNFHVSFVSLNDATQIGAGQWTKQATANSAKLSSQDQSAVAYIGDFDSGATAFSLPLNNENDVLQITPGSPYTGFTDTGRGVLPNDPSHYYPFGVRTLARLVPSNAGQATATLAYMRSLGVHRLYWLADTSDPRNADIGPQVARSAAGAGIAVVGHSSLSTAPTTPPSVYAAIARTVAATRADAVLFGAEAGPGAQSVWSRLHTALPRAKLFIPSALAVPAFLVGLGAAASATDVASPYLEPDQYPPQAKAVFSAYRRTFGSAPTVYTLYGYEAMRDVLAAIRKAGRHAADRESLRKAFFGLGTITGVIGTYRIDARGDTSMRSFDGYRVGAGGQLVLDRRIS